MNRLTQKRVNGIKTGYWSASKKDELVARLAEYEDTGLTPEEAEALEKQTKKVALRICGAMGEKYECPECGSGLRDADLFAGHCKWCGQAIREN